MGGAWTNVTQQVRVIQTNARDQRDPGMQHVRCVEPTSEAHFYHGHLHRFGCEIQETQRDSGFKETRLHGLEDRPESENSIIDPFIWCWYAVYAHPLIQVMQVRRGVQARSPPGGRTDSGQHGGRRAFAIRSCHMYALEGLVGPSHGFQQGYHAFESGPVRPRAAICETRKVQQIC